MDNKSVKEIWSEILSEQILNFSIRNEKLKENPDASILCAHLTTSNAVMKSQESLVSMYEESIPISVLQNGLFDYVALGHNHKHQAVSTKPPIIYSGSIHHTSFNEEGEEKGFVDVKIENGITTWSFRKIPVRKYTTIEIDTIDKDPTQAILDGIERIKAANKRDIVGAVVRLVVKIERKALQYINYNLISKALDEASYFLKPNFEIIGEEEDKGRSIHEDLDSIQALKEFLKIKGIKKEEMQSILALGEEIIKEVEGKG